METEEKVELHHADCLDAMRGMDANSADCIITDPPYAISFLGEKWDSFGKGTVAFQQAMTPIFAEALRVAKPGAYLLAFGGSRTYHRLACAIEDAGWRVYDCIMYVHSQGFPKGVDAGKAIDAKLGAKREVVGVRTDGAATASAMMNHGRADSASSLGGAGRVYEVTAPATEEARKWEGWNSQLKPAFEPIVVARKDLDGTIAENLLKWGTGAMNIDGCRVPSDEPITVHSPARKTLLDSGHRDLGTWQNTKGRWPADFMHDGSDEVLALFPDNVKGGSWNRTDGARPFNNNGRETNYRSCGKDDSRGSAARFFYCAKPSKKERGEYNTHSTVKPLALMRWLVTLVSREGGVVLDPFMGSGTTGVACVQLGRRFVGIEREAEYYEIAHRRISEAGETAASEGGTSFCSATPGGSGVPPLQVSALQSGETPLLPGEGAAPSAPPSAVQLELF